MMGLGDAMLTWRGAGMGALLALATLSGPAAWASGTNAPSSPRPAIGDISRSTGHLFREGLASGIIAEGRNQPTLKTNDQGLLTDRTLGALPANLWDGLDPDALGRMIAALRPTPSLPPTLHLAQRLLLSDSRWPDDQDLQALRLQKMVTFHLGIDAAHLYAHWAITDPNPNLLLAGVHALMAAGQYASACLELRAALDRLDQDQANVKALITACSAADKGQTLSAPYGPATNWTDFATSPDLVFSGPPPLNADESGVESGLDRLWRAQSLEKRRINPAQIKELMGLLRDQPLKTKLQFVPTLAALDGRESLDPAAIREVAAILLAVDHPNADRWLARLRTAQPTPPAHDPALAALFLLGQMRGLPAASGPIPLSFTQLVADNDIKLLEMFKKITELLDTAPNFIDNPDVVYEKKKGLTKASHYVMPMSTLQQHLVEGSQQGQTGRVVLASLLLLDTPSASSIDAELLAQILKGLITVGLNEEARQVATVIFLGVTFTGEQKNGTSRPSGTTKTESTSVD